MPGAPLESFDIGYASHGLYALADRSNAAVDLIDTRTHRFAGRVAGFTGAQQSGAAGPNGIVVVGNRLWAGDGLSDVKLIDLSSRRTLATISTGGKHRVDELAYDARDQLVVAANNADDPPFVSFIAATPPYAVMRKLPLPQATNGIEQPVWDAQTQTLLLAVPVLDGHKDDGGIAVIDPATATLTRMMHVSQCMPAGLAAGPDHQLLVGCSDDAVDAGFAAKSLLLDARTGHVTATFAQVGGSDEVWYDAASGRYALAAVANPGGPVLGLIDAKGKRWLGNIHTGKGAHSVAAEDRQYFAPVAAGDADCPRGCVKIMR
ncbi:cytochrome C nitrite reductase [Paraburkholderia acidisoli]|uniref:Cytochrome C nitrite reductase n=1 Tax=Paraburkholderia acidisoli TaxID=2571748 RepID=A0A7Z2JJZ3_9BURK|nr:cytochrome C nitrite reductase [Paraburkholderia acidisoli]